MSDAAQIPAGEWQSRQAWAFAQGAAAYRRTLRKGFLRGLLAGLILAEVLTGLRGCQSFHYEQERAAFPKPPFTFVVGKSGSMFPAIKGGETLRCDPVTLPQIHRGMILVYDSFSGGGFEIHRVQSVSGNRVRMAPDWPFTVDGRMMLGTDELIYFEQVIGCWIDAKDRRTWPK